MDPSLKMPCGYRRGAFSLLPTLMKLLSRISKARLRSFVSARGRKKMPLPALMGHLQPGILVSMGLPLCMRKVKPIGMGSQSTDTLWVEEEGFSLPSVPPHATREDSRLFGSLSNARRVKMSLPSHTEHLEPEILVIRNGISSCIGGGGYPPTQSPPPTGHLGL